MKGVIKYMFNKSQDNRNSNNGLEDFSKNVNSPRIVLVPEEMLGLFENKISELTGLVARLSRPEEVVFDNEEAAKFLKVSTRTLQKYRERHLLTYSQHDRMIWYRKSDLLDFLQRHQIQGR